MRAVGAVLAVGAARLGAMAIRLVVVVALPAHRHHFFGIVLVPARSADVASAPAWLEAQQQSACIGVISVLTNASHQLR